MDDIKAAEILKSLAAGMDPAAGQPLTSIAPLQSPDVVCALFLAADSLEMRLRQSRRQSTLPRNAGKPWSSDEDERLLAGFDAGHIAFGSGDGDPSGYYAGVSLLGNVRIESVEALEPAEAR